MNTPPFEVADIIRLHGKSFIERNRSWLSWLHVRVLLAIERCRNSGARWTQGSLLPVRP
jgi:hypothetical protein